MIIQNIDKGNPFDCVKTGRRFWISVLFTRSGCRMNICNILTWYHRMSSESTSRLPEIPGMGGCGPAGA